MAFKRDSEPGHAYLFGATMKWTTAPFQPEATVLHVPHPAFKFSQDGFYNEHGSSGPRNFHHPWNGEIHSRACLDSCTWADITGEGDIPLDMTCRLTNCTAPYESLLGCATSASGHGSSDQGVQFRSCSFSMSGHSFQVCQRCHLRLTATVQGLGTISSATSTAGCKMLFLRSTSRAILQTPRVHTLAFKAAFSGSGAKYSGYVLTSD